MKTQVLYASMILTVSALLISSMIFSADAREITYSNVIQGNGMYVYHQGSFKLNVEPLSNSNEFVVSYDFIDSDGIHKVTCDHVLSSLVKISAMKKGSIEFNTGDKNLGTCTATVGTVPQVTISVNVATEGVPEVTSFEVVHGCNDLGECSTTVGTKEIARGTAVVSITGIPSFTLSIHDANTSVEISKVNQKETYWTK